MNNSYFTMQDSAAVRDQGIVDADGHIIENNVVLL
jgi:hypothetical protein